MTDAEQLLWKYVRRKQLCDIQFYRQKPIGHYIVDFYAPAAKLVIEIDGGIKNPPARSATRCSRPPFSKEVLGFMQQNFA